MLCDCLEAAMLSGAVLKRKSCVILYPFQKACLTSCPKFSSPLHFFNDNGAHSFQYQWGSISTISFSFFDAPFLLFSQLSIISTIFPSCVRLQSATECTYRCRFQGLNVTKHIAYRFIGKTSSHPNCPNAIGALLDTKSLLANGSLYKGQTTAL